MKNKKMTYRQVRNAVIKMFYNNFDVKTIELNSNLDDVFSGSWWAEMQREYLPEVVTQTFNIPMDTDFEFRLAGIDEPRVTITEVVEYVCKAKNIDVPVLKTQSVKKIKPIQLVVLDDKNLAFRQGNKTLALNSPKTTHLIQILNKQLQKQ